MAEPARATTMNDLWMLFGISADDGGRCAAGETQRCSFSCM